MKALSTYISTLLFDHDCVIIPGFGGIVGNRKPAWFNEVNQRFYPAYKDLGFQPEPQKQRRLTCKPKSLKRRNSILMQH